LIISVGINDFQNIRCVTKTNDILDGRKAYYLLTPWNRVLLEKPTSLQLVKKFSAFYGT